MTAIEQLKERGQMTEDKAANEQLVLEGCGMTGPELPFGRRGRLVAERLYTAPITAGFGVRVAHEVTDEAFAAGRGDYEALCGCVFVPAPLAAHPADRAPRAWASLRLHTQPLPHHADVFTGCCGDWCRCASCNGPPQERTSSGEHCAEHGAPVGVVPGRLAQPSARRGGQRPDRDAGDGLRAALAVRGGHQPSPPPTGLRCPTCTQGASQACVQFPVSDADSATGLSPELVASLALRRAHDGGVAKAGDRYLDRGHPAPAYLTGPSMS